MRKNLRGLGAWTRVGLGGGGGGELDAATGEALGGVSGICGVVSFAAKTGVPVKPASLTFDAFMLVATGPGGGGSEVAELLEPGSTIGLESLILGLSAYPL